MAHLRRLALAAALASCQPAPAPAPSKAPAPVLVSNPTTEPAAAPAAAPDAGLDAAADASPKAAPPPASDPALFGCGSIRCKAGSESCCLFSDESVCLPSVPPGPNDHVQVLASQLEACGATKHTYSLTGVRRCDESSDCARGQACCGMFLFGGATADFCVPMKTPGRSPCDFSEVCISDDTCRVAGSKCIEGACAKPATPSCNGQRCAGEKSACCGDPPSCRAASECAEQPRFRCTSPKDCLPGEHCQMQVMGSVCTNFLDLANTRSVCDKSADCGPGDALCRRYVCKDSEVRGIKVCQCA